MLQQTMIKNRNQNKYLETSCTLGESEIRPLEIQNQLNSGLFEGPTSNGQAFGMAIAKVSII